MYERYSDWSERTANTLALMDWEKINYDLVEAMVVFVADGGTRDCPLPNEGSILVFLPGMQVFCFCVYHSILVHSSRYLFIFNSRAGDYDFVRAAG